MPRPQTAPPPPVGDDPSQDLTEEDGFSSDGFANPLLGEPEVVDEAAQHSASCDGTAALGAKLINFGVTVQWNAPLTDPETAELVHDLSAVLAKYDAPDLPWAEEVSLMATLGGIVFRRVAHERASQAAMHPQPQPPPQEGVAGHDSTSVGQKGVGQNGFGSQAGFSGRSSEAADILS